MQLKAYAKLNLTLDITGTAGAYHLLDSVVTTVDVFDVLTLEARPDGQCTVKTVGADIPAGRNNALLAAKSFCRRFGTDGVDIVLEKHIPVGAGMGGSSADSAAVIAGMGRLFCVKDDAALKALADENGSDTGYLLTGGIARIRGRGEYVTPLPFAALHFVILPTSAVSTAACYARYDALGLGGGTRTQRAAALLARGRVEAAARLFSNDLTAAAMQFADVGGALSRMRACGPLAAWMTGSGGAVCGLFPDRAAAERAQGVLGEGAIAAESILP